MVFTDTTCTLRSSMSLLYVYISTREIMNKQALTFQIQILNAPRSGNKITQNKCITINDRQSKNDIKG